MVWRKRGEYWMEAWSFYLVGVIIAFSIVGSKPF